MADFFFYTDPLSLIVQSIELDQGWFGPEIESNGSLSNQRYCLDNFNIANRKAPAYAVSDSIVLFQYNDKGLLNAILKPLNQPQGFGQSNIDFFIYKGLNPSWLFENYNASKPFENYAINASNNANDIRKKLYDDHKNNVKQGLTTSEKPKSENIGTLYREIISPSGDDLIFDIKDEVLINKVFFIRDDIQLPLVKAGTLIGQFSDPDSSSLPSSKVGFQIIEERLGYESTMKIARTYQHILDVGVEPLGEKNTPQKFLYNHKKEEILHYYDVCAFYGTLHNNKITVLEMKDDGSSVKIENFNTLLNPFRNKNNIYIDVKNGQNYSYNYYQEYEEEDFIIEHTGIDDPDNDFDKRSYIGYYNNTTTPLKTNGWPRISTKIDVIKKNGNLSFLLTIPNYVLQSFDDGSPSVNVVPNESILFVINGRIKTGGSFVDYVGFSRDKYGSILSNTLTFEGWNDTESDTKLFLGSMMIRIKLFYHSIGTTSKSRPAALLSRHYHFLDLQFPIFDMQKAIPFTFEANRISYKTYTTDGDLIYNDFVFPPISYIPAVGIAEDQASYVFYLYSYDVDISDLAPDLESKEWPYQLLTENRIKDVSFLFSITEDNSRVDLITNTIKSDAYLRFLEHNSKYFTRQLDVRKFEAITITKQEFTDLQNIVTRLTPENKFIENTRIFLSVRHVSSDFRPTYYTEKLELVLKGLREVKEGESLKVDEHIVPTGVFINGITDKR